MLPHDRFPSIPGWFRPLSTNIQVENVRLVLGVNLLWDRKKYAQTIMVHPGRQMQIMSILRGPLPKDTDTD